MENQNINRPPLIDWGVASRVQPGQAVSGSSHVVRAFSGGTLAGVVAGLGAAEEAAITAKTVAALLRRYAKEPVTALVKRCHKNLMMTRGAVLALASFSATEDSCSWLGVGNLVGLLLHADPAARPAQEPLRSYDGVVGYHLPMVQETSLALQPGDTLVLAGQGLPNQFGFDPQQSPQALAEGLLQLADVEATLVFVARYLGRNYEPHGG